MVPAGEDSRCRNVFSGCPGLQREHVRRRVDTTVGSKDDIDGQRLRALQPPRVAWERILQWAYYLVDTRDLKLVLRRTGGAPVQYVDSSALNGPRGGSFGGHVTQFVDGDPASPDARVSGEISGRCIVPRVLGDSSAAAELIMCSIALKQTLGERMLARELGQGPTGPTGMYMDATAVLHGAEAERVSREARYLAARYEMLRSAVRDHHVELRKVPTDFNTGDVLTKALAGRAFRLHRGRIL